MNGHPPPSPPRVNVEVTPEVWSSSGVKVREDGRREVEEEEEDIAILVGAVPSTAVGGTNNRIERAIRGDPNGWKMLIDADARDTK